MKKSILKKIIKYEIDKSKDHGILSSKLKKLTDESIKDLWKLYYDSSFIYPTKEKYIKPIINEINLTWKILLSPKTTFFKNFAFNENGKLVGAASAVQIYEYTWLFQHLATHTHPIKIVPVYLTLGLAEFLMKIPDLKYLQTYYRPENPWPNRLYGAFFENFAVKEYLNFTKYSFLEKGLISYKKDLCKDISLNSDFIVEELQKGKRADKEVIKNYFIKMINPLLNGAYSLDENGIHLTRTGKVYSARGLKRKRCVFLVKQKDEIISFALVEDTSLGVNLSGLLNAFRIYDVKKDTKNFDMAKMKLIEKVLDFYRLHGNKTAVLLTTENDLSLYTRAGFEKTKEYICFTSHKNAIEPFYRFVMKKYPRLKSKV